MEPEIETTPPSATNLQQSIPDVHVSARPFFYAEYGVRSDDDAMVVHLYVPSYSYEKLVNKQITESFNVSAAERAITAAAEATLAPKRLQVVGNYVRELDSFCLEIFDLGKAFDPYAVVEQFLERLEKEAA